MIEDYLSVSDAAAWEPAPAAYAHALRSAGVEPARATLVAVHPWDLEGARRAGLRTAWVNRSGAAYPDHFARADHEVATLGELATLVGRWTGRRSLVTRGLLRDPGRAARPATATATATATE